MATKFRYDGVVFPSSYSDGKLTINLSNDIKVTSDVIRDLGEDFPVSNFYFETCSIMTVLQNDKHILVMRFDGTMSIYNNDYELLGFNKFDPDSILSLVNIIETGTVKLEGKKGLSSLSIYAVDGYPFLFLDPPIVSYPIRVPIADNKQFFQDIAAGTRFYPVIQIKDTIVDVNDGKYTLNNIGIMYNKGGFKV